VITVLEPVMDSLVMAGGFAVNHHGYTRNTLDIDFVCADLRVESITTCLQQGGYTHMVRGPVARHFSHPDTGFRVDVLLVEERTFQELRAAAVESEMGEQKVPTLSLHHVIAMKLHALSQQPVLRSAKDALDIAWLVYLNEVSAEEDLKPLCLRYATAELYHEISRILETLQT